MDSNVLSPAEGHKALSTEKRPFGSGGELVTGFERPVTRNFLSPAKCHLRSDYRLNGGEPKAVQCVTATVGLRTTTSPRLIRRNVALA